MGYVRVLQQHAPANVISVRKQERKGWILPLCVRTTARLENKVCAYSNRRMGQGHNVAPAGGISL